MPERASSLRSEATAPLSLQIKTTDAALDARRFGGPFLRYIEDRAMRLAQTAAQPLMASMSACRHDMEDRRDHLRERPERGSTRV